MHVINYFQRKTDGTSLILIHRLEESSNQTFTYKLSDVSLVEDESTSKPGRFTLYPTQNKFNFILLDQTDGRTWQVQWSTKSEEVGMWRIW